VSAASGGISSIGAGTGAAAAGGLGFGASAMHAVAPAGAGGSCHTPHIFTKQSSNPWTLEKPELTEKRKKSVPQKMARHLRSLFQSCEILCGSPHQFWLASPHQMQFENIW